jgi:MFS family permease
MSLISEYKIGPGRAAWRRLLQLDQPVPVRTDQEVEAEVERNYRWNFTVNFLDGVAFWIGYSFVSVSTIVPLFISKLTFNPLVIGLVAVLGQAGWYLPQIFVAGSTERMARKKPIVVNLGLFLERVPAWLWPVAALMAPLFPILALLVFLFGFAWHGIGAGAIAPAWQDMVARCFPVKRRGRFFGLTTFVGTGSGAIGAVFSSWLLKTYPFPTNFFYAFLIAAIFINLSWVFLAFTREPVQPAPAPPPSGTNHFWRRLVKIVQQDHNFRKFLLTRLLIALGTMGMGFVTVAAVHRWQVADSTVGHFTVALLIGQGLGNLLAGLLADRYGHKLSLVVGVVVAAIGFALAWLAPGAIWYYAVFVSLGMAIGIQIVSGILITMEFSAPEQRPTYMGVANTVAGVGSSIAPLIGGWLAASFSYSGTFAVGMVVNVIGLILLQWYVKEPRWQPVVDPVGVENIGQQYR